MTTPPRPGAGASVVRFGYGDSNSGIITPDTHAMTQPRHDGRERNWREDPRILERLPRVERLHFRGWTLRQIAAEVDVSFKTVARDLERCRELWRERAGTEVAEHRAAIVAALADNERLALEAYEWDKQAEAAVLYGEPVESADGRTLEVYRDHKGAAQFRGGKAAALAERRQAAMAKAKVLGIVVDKQEQVGEMLVRVVERERPSDG